MTDVPTNGSTSWRLGDLERRLTRIEDLKPDVMASELGNIRDEVRGLKRAFYTFGFSMVGGALLFAFTAFQVFGS